MQPNTIDQYLSLFTGETRTRLDTLRALIKKIVPKEAEESISYAIPTYKLGKNRLVYFAGYDKHVSLYPLPKSAPDSFMKQMDQYKTGKGTVRFYHEKPLPIEFIKQFVAYRLEDAQQGR
jgi:uncharacterized protein YdhG (YjbR/CyaY superfamily)